MPHQLTGPQKRRTLYPIVRELKEAAIE